MIFLTPFWSASTEAYQKNDIAWIKNSIKRYNQLNLVIALGGLLMLVLSSTVYRLWLGDSLFVASIITNFNTFILAPIQYNQIINKGKKGIWIR